MMCDGQLVQNAGGLNTKLTNKVLRMFLKINRQKPMAKQYFCFCIFFLCNLSKISCKPNKNLSETAFFVNNQFLTRNWKFWAQYIYLSTIKPWNGLFGSRVFSGPGGVLIPPYCFWIGAKTCLRWRNWCCLPCSRSNRWVGGMRKTLSHDSLIFIFFQPEVTHNFWWNVWWVLACLLHIPQNSTSATCLTLSHLP
jgi:hypothetical protein